MSAQRQLYTAEFKRAAVSWITDHGYGVSAAAGHVGLHAHRLRKWQQKMAHHGASAFPGNGRLRREEAALQRLRQANQRLRMERASLQTAALLFAKEAS